jgi:hypothetical protein
VFRDHATLAAANADNIVGRMWVRRDGYVIRQELTLLGKQLRFERMSKEDAAEFLEKVNRQAHPDYVADPTTVDSDRLENEGEAADAPNDLDPSADNQ